MTQPHIDNNPSTQVKQTAAQGTQSSTNATNPGGGWRQMKSTTAFRALNFELYVKPVSVIYSNKDPLNLLGDANRCACVQPAKSTYM